MLVFIGTKTVNIMQKFIELELVPGQARLTRTLRNPLFGSLNPQASVTFIYKYQVRSYWFGFRFWLTMERCRYSGGINICKKIPAAQDELRNNFKERYKNDWIISTTEVIKMA